MKLFVGIDPHKHSLTAAVIDQTGATIAVEHLPVTAAGHRSLASWADAHGQIERWGVEGAGGLGRHTASFLLAAGHDVRDVNAALTSDRRRRRGRGKTDTIDAVAIAGETLGDPTLPLALKRAGIADRPSEVREQTAILHRTRKTLAKLRVLVLDEAEVLLRELPDELRDQLPRTSRVRTRLRAITRVDGLESAAGNTQCRLGLLRRLAEQLRDLEDQDKALAKELAELVDEQGSTLAEICGISSRAAAEILVEVGDPRRFSESAFARFNGTAPIPASSAEGDDEPTRHRLNRGGNRRLNAALHRVAVT